MIWLTSRLKRIDFSTGQSAVRCVSPSMSEHVASSPSFLVLKLLCKQRTSRLLGGSSGFVLPSGISPSELCTYLLAAKQRLPIGLAGYNQLTPFLSGHEDSNFRARLVPYYVLFFFVVSMRETVHSKHKRYQKITLLIKPKSQRTSLL